MSLDLFSKLPQLIYSMTALRLLQKSAVFSFNAKDARDARDARGARGARKCVQFKCRSSDATILNFVHS